VWDHDRVELEAGPRAARVSTTTIVVATLLGCSAPEVAAAPDNVPASAHATSKPALPPTERDVIDALLRHAHVRLTHASCVGVTGVQGDETLGDYVAHLLAQLAAAHAEGTPATLRVGCDPGQTDFRCHFAVRVEAEDPWHYAIEFDLASGGEILASSIECPGAA
jgi:hypothetical protein